MNKIATISLSSLYLVSCAGEEPTKAKRPNLVFIMADQWRADAQGYMGIEPVKTPNMDRLAKEGITFTQAMSAYPISSPARGMLMTGKYPFSTGITTNCMSQSTPYGCELDIDAICWSDILKREGYNLGYIGKWHLDSPYEPYIDTYNNRGEIAWNEWCPPERRHGFDYWMAYGTYDYHIKPMYWNNDAKREEFFFVDQWGPEYEVDRAIEYISANKDNPFAVVISMNPPHTGYDLVPDRYKQIYKDLNVDSLALSKPSIPAEGSPMGDNFRTHIRDYYACVSGVDENIGRVVEYLKREGLFENTIIVVTSDHGDCIGTHEEITKGNYYEEAVGIPMVITYPAEIKPRFEDKAQMGVQDLYPTLLTLMGLEDKIPSDIETVNFGDFILNGGESPVKWQPYMRLECNDLTTGVRGIRSNEYTYARHYDKGELVMEFLVDNIADPYQINNIAANKPELCSEFSKITEELFKKMGDKLIF